MLDFILIVAVVIVAAVSGALWRRWLGMKRENTGAARPIQVVVGCLAAIVLIAMPAEFAGAPFWLALLIALAPIGWLTLPAEFSNFWMTDLISRAPWRWPGGFMIEDEDFTGDPVEDYPRPWSEFFVGALGFGVASIAGLAAAALMSG